MLGSDGSDGDDDGDGIKVIIQRNEAKLKFAGLVHNENTNKANNIHRCQLESHFPSKRFLQLMAEDIARERMRVGTVMVMVMLLAMAEIMLIN